MTATPVIPAWKKAAVLVAAVGPEAARPMLELLEEADIHRLAKALGDLDSAPGPVVERVTADFLDALDQVRAVSGGPATARKVVDGILGEGAADRILATPQSKPPATVWERLAALPAADLAARLAKEQPVLTGTILAQLPEAVSGAVLPLLPEEMLEPVIVQMGRAVDIAPRVLKTLADAVERSLLQSRPASRPDPAVRIAAALDQLPPSRSESLLEALKAADPPLGEAVARRLLSFAELPARLEPAGVQALIKETPQDVLLKALKLARDRAPAVAEMIMANMSKRAAEQVEEELGEMQPVRLRDAESAQAEMVRTVKALVESGDIVLKSLEEEAEDMV